MRKDTLRRLEALETRRFQSPRVAKFLITVLANPDCDADELRDRLGIGDFLPAEAREFMLEAEYERMRRKKQNKDEAV